MNSKASAWYCVVLFTLLYAVSLVDRYIFSLVAEPISRELGLSDQKLGFLLGAGFAITYSVMGLPAAHFLDRSRRIPIVAAGVMLWSLATISAAFATSFAGLAASRAGIAIGEAVLTPAAISLIADLFPREKRGAPVALYSSAAPVMGTGALVVGAAMLNLAPMFQPLTGMVPWRTTMLLVGAPGVVLSLVLLATVREPARVLSGPTAKPTDSDLAGFIAELRKSWRVFLPFYVGLGAGSMYIFGLLSWAPTIIIRLYGMTAGDAGYLLGLIGIPAALASAFLWPWLAARFAATGRAHALLACMLFSAVLLAPIFVLSPLAGSALGLVVGVGLVKLVNATGTLGPLTIQTYGPSQMRARLMALMVLSSNVVGLSGGSLLVPTFAAMWPGDPRALVYGVSLLGAVAAVLSIGGFWLSYRWAGAKTRAGQLNLAV